ncbi:MAG: family 43 glycosylhydrolase, partial [Bacteroidota bacterium]
MYKLIIILVFFLPVFSSLSQDVSWDSSQAGNPIVPGHFADPSLVEMDGKYYIYATTVSKFMEPMVWISEDLQRWEVQQLDITGKHLFWAPSMLKGDDGKYYLYYSSGFDFKCHLYVGETPTGPWDYKGKVEDGFDLQIYRDPNDGKVYGSSSDPSSRPRLVEFNSDVNNAG